jgi:hypothetical protein
VLSWHSAKPLPNARQKTLGKKVFADKFFAVYSLPSAALGKAFVDGKWHSAKHVFPVVLEVDCFMHARPVLFYNLNSLFLMKMKRNSLVFSREKKKVDLGDLFQRTLICLHCTNLDEKRDIVEVGHYTVVYHYKTPRLPAGGHATQLTPWLQWLGRSQERVRGRHLPVVAAHVATHAPVQLT